MRIVTGDKNEKDGRAAGIGAFERVTGEEAVDGCHSPLLEV